MEAVMDDAYILITDKKISSIQDLLPLLEQIVQGGKKLVIICEDLEGEALTTIFLQIWRGTFNCVAVKAPGFGDRRKEMLQDIAILTGGTVVCDDLGLELKDTTLDQLAAQEASGVEKENTIIVHGAGNPDAIKSRISEIKSQIETATSDFDREKLQKRLAKLSGGVAVLKVGAATEVEMKEKKLRIEDALSATKAAVEEGVVSGGGVALINAATAVEKILPSCEGDEKTGAKIVLKALEEPMRQIAATQVLMVLSSLIRFVVPESPVMASMLTMKFTPICSELELLTRLRLLVLQIQNAASAAAIISTTESVVANKKEENPAPMAAPQGGGMGMY